MNQRLAARPDMRFCSGLGTTNATLSILTVARVPPRTSVVPPAPIAPAPASCDGKEKEPAAEAGEVRKEKERPDIFVSESRRP